MSFRLAFKDKKKLSKSVQKQEVRSYEAVVYFQEENSSNDLIAKWKRADDILDLEKVNLRLS